MGKGLRIVNLIALIGGIGLLGMSLWPGYAGGCWVVFALLAIVVLGAVWLFFAGMELGDWMRGSNPRFWRRVTIAPILVCVTLASLVYYIPRRAVFLLHESAFAAHIASAPVLDYSHGNPLGWIGIYHVDEYATDPRGGTYFRTGSGQHGLGPDTMSYGFAYKPNPIGTPFGRAAYGVWKIFGDWYWFRALNDYF